MMTVQQTQIAWGIRAGKEGDAHGLFIDKGVIALADAGLGDLSKLEATRDAFYRAYRELHPDESRTGSAGVAGKFYRFIHEVKVGDLIIYPSVVDKQVYVGEVSGEYEYVRRADYPHQRKVKWKWVVPKDALSQPAKYELGAARTFFQLKKNVAEVIRKTKESSVQRFQSSKAK
jgi:restriction system protein